ncbi:hypothetical protein C8R43DRAFT_1117317 [Mycena crocata]|nr:hypothetical protein C8R43DRAFT_1117317 [Mycena crocata]
MNTPGAISLIAMGLELEKSQRRTISADCGLMERHIRLSALLDKFRELQSIYMPLTVDLLPSVKPYALPETTPLLLPSTLAASDRDKCVLGLAEIELVMRKQQCAIGLLRLDGLNIQEARAVRWQKKFRVGEKVKVLADMERIQQAKKEEKERLEAATTALLRLASEEGETAERASANTHAALIRAHGGILAGAALPGSATEDEQGTGEGESVVDEHRRAHPAERASANAHASTDSSVQWDLGGAALRGSAANDGHGTGEAASVVGEHARAQPAERAGTNPNVEAEHNKAVRLSEEEEERATLNDELSMVQVLKDQNPGDQLLEQEFKFKFEDYKHFGRFIPDSENAEWHRRKDAELSKLVGMRHDVDYFNAVDEFEAVFGIWFKPNDGLAQKFTMKHRAMDMYDDLMDRADGDFVRAAKGASRSFSFSVSNPFSPDDERHMDFHFHLQHRNHEFQNGRSVPPRTGTAWRFIFAIPSGMNNVFDIINHYCLRRVLREEICQEFLKASQRARLPKAAPHAIPADVFYGH